MSSSRAESHLFRVVRTCEVGWVYTMLPTLSQAHSQTCAKAGNMTLNPLWDVPSGCPQRQRSRGALRSDVVTVISRFGVCYLILGLSTATANKGPPSQLFVTDSFYIQFC